MTKTADAAKLDEVLKEHACECGRYEIEQWTGEVPEGADPGDFLELRGTGCVQTTTRTFAPGHDAKLKSLLIEAGASGWSVRRNDGGVASIDDAQHWAARFDFAHMIYAGIARAGQKRADKLAKKEARELARAATKTVRAPKTRTVKKTEPEHVTIKVGRWEYLGTVNTQTNEAIFTSANGEVKTTKKFSIVTK